MNFYPPSVPINPAWRPPTVTVQAGRPARTPGAPMNPPITLSSTYVHDSEKAYGRDGNDGWGAFEAAMGTLDGGFAVSYSSGLAAATSIADLVPTGGTVVLPKAAYYGVTNIFARMEARERLKVRTVDADNTEEVIAAAQGADVVWVESIANPTMVIADIPAIVDGVRGLGVLTVVDATFATPLRQRPLELGADIVLYSATKLIGGHSDLLLGVAVCKSEHHAQFLATHRHDHGSVPGGLEAFLALRGLHSLAVRLDRAESNAAELSRRLNAHPSVTRVNYPGLPDDPQHEKAVRVLPSGCGNMLSFELDATPERTDEILESLSLLTHATSWGGVETAIERRTRRDAEVVAGVPMTLCRVSVGIEDVEDLWEDLNASIDKVLG
ncbi:cystathionine gamma-synthase [Corynebacterium glutamicum]|uniref:aminotransferase class I/II-fold pyridoxal phosphate-dependent enzyme n=1 Tax=Corynebacterium glutamicum TaxID=1718 RepID=UPI0004F69991|nr:aminotransferase class I/II-fold pyridoxal phosphate-dependent enzyme [Corynebacterium glutamicum]AIK86185.1 cystathionine gamma-synthase [Corynebacterium glutamicum]AIK88968.1 cystathionine gamma-synthase [Corynebacterium glutamicum]